MKLNLFPERRTKGRDDVTSRSKESPGRLCTHKSNSSTVADVWASNTEGNSQIGENPEAK